MKVVFTEELIALRAIKEIEEGQVVFPGFGIPMDRMPELIPKEKGVIMHSENGLVGHGSVIAEESEWDIDQVNAAGHPVFLMPGACFIDQLDSFAIMRAGHVDIAFLGAYQVSEKGDLANWTLKARGMASVGIGGAMDIATGAKRIVVLMRHRDKKGRPRIVKECSEPLTARGVVNTIITDIALIQVTPHGLVLEELAGGWTPEEVQAITEPRLIVRGDLKKMESSLG
jgi:3-oxoacid CoA-transferase B subunit